MYTYMYVCMYVCMYILGWFHLLWKIFKLVTFIPPTHHLVTPSIMTMYAKYLLIWTIFRTCANQFYFCYFDIIVNWHLAVITREVAAALDRTNLSDRKAANFICKTFQTGCGRTFYKSKCSTTSSNEASWSFCRRLHRSRKRASRSPTHFSLWTKRCKTCICTKTPW